jgi:Ca2+-binding RTX toxin-like protein
MPKVIIAKAANGDGIALSGQSLNDHLTAGNGVQFLYGTGGNDTLIGGIGTQELYGGTDSDSIVGGTGNQTLAGGAGDDMLIAGSGNQTLYGGSGVDYIIVGNGNQTLEGGDGLDTLDFSRLNGKIEIDQDLHVATLNDSITGAVLFNYSLQSFNTVVGTSGDDTIWAAEFTPRTYYGGAGNDKIYSESGGDVVYGGAGADEFRWFKKYIAVNHTDEIKDFVVGTDHLNLADLLKGQYTSSGVYMNSPTYNQVVQLVATTDMDGNAATLVKALAGNGVWRDVVVLDGVDASTVTITDLVL